MRLGVVGCADFVVYEVVEAVAGEARHIGLCIDFGGRVVDPCDGVDSVREGGSEVPRTLV